MGARCRQNLLWNDEAGSASAGSALSSSPSLSCELSVMSIVFLLKETRYKGGGAGLDDLLLVLLLLSSNIPGTEVSASKKRGGPNISHKSRK
jgi:hypothetical protein